MRQCPTTGHAAALRIGATFAVVLGTIVLLSAMPVGAQQAGASASQATPAPPQTTPTPAPPESTQSTFPAGSEAQDDQEWLTAYMMAHQGYRLNHMDELQSTFGKMTPTQLGTLRDFYEQKHAATMQQQALFHRMQSMQVSQAEAQIAKQQRAMNLINTEQTEAANQEQQQINTAHQEAYEAAMQNRTAPYNYGGYGGYGGYPYGYGGFPGIRPYGY